MSILGNIGQGLGALRQNILVQREKNRLLEKQAKKDQEKKALLEQQKKKASLTQGLRNLEQQRIQAIQSNASPELIKNITSKQTEIASQLGLPTGNLEKLTNSQIASMQQAKEQNRERFNLQRSQKERIAQKQNDIRILGLINQANKQFESDASPEQKRRSAQLVEFLKTKLSRNQRNKLNALDQLSGKSNSRDFQDTFIGAIDEARKNQLANNLSPKDAIEKEILSIQKQKEDNANSFTTNQIKNITETQKKLIKMMGNTKNAEILNLAEQLGVKLSKQKSLFDFLIGSLSDFNQEALLGKDIFNSKSIPENILDFIKGNS